MKKQKHWLYTASCEINKVVETETDCSKCLHKKVCKISTHGGMRFLCHNYEFGSSGDMNSCQSCLHKYTRFDSKQPIPCFHCGDFKEGQE